MHPRFSRGLLTVVCALFAVGRASLLLAAPTPQPGDIVLFAKNAAPVAGAWKLVADASAAGGTRIGNPDAGTAKLAAAAAAPASYFELTFTPEAGKAYRLWIRGKAD